MQFQELFCKNSEFDKIKEILGRTPNFCELSIFGVMWSEHCSYKNSIHWLKKLPKDGPNMLVQAGEENAGLVDIGDNLACCFKIESHNPLTSFVGSVSFSVKFCINISTSLNLPK